ncbi:hypothetical protein ACFFK0_20185 [Paenibacillus chartarius]|uniref:PhiEco32-like amidoligase-type 2 protein n=1 Tax=Paenibacillus chartarius TaxID=747481 RepID=A0ABV6DQ11_9BACL
MSVYVLHGNEPGTLELLQGLKVPHGTALPSGEFGGRVLIWGERKAEAVLAAILRQAKAAEQAAERLAEQEQQSETAAFQPATPMKVTGLWSSAKAVRPGGGSRRAGKAGASAVAEAGKEKAGGAAAAGSGPADNAAQEKSLKEGQSRRSDRRADLAVRTEASAASEASAATAASGASAASSSARPSGGQTAVSVGMGAYDGFLALPLMPKEPVRQLRQHGVEADERTFGIGSEAELTEKEDVLRDYSYVYRVPVFHLEALTLFRLQREALLLRRMPGQKPGEFVEVGLAEPTYPSQRAVREAIKALYALGLDYGEAVVGIRPGGRLAVLAAWPQPDARLGGLYAEAIVRYAASFARERERSEPAMLGADPEFLLVNGAGKVVAASRYLERDGEAGCDAIVLRGHRVITPLAELRPRPSVQPRRLAANLRGAMHLAASRIEDAGLTWLAGGMPLPGFPLGGHIHFSRVWLNSHLLRALDNYLALPLMLVEADTTRRRRPRYGFLGDFRRQPHGGFEYRTLPSWMVTPQMAVGVLSLASLIADGYRQLPGAGFGPARLPLGDVAVQEAYYRGDKNAVLPAVAKLWEELERLPGYAEFAADLAPLKKRVLHMEPWDETADLRRSWKIPPFDKSRANGPEIVL